MSPSERREMIRKDNTDLSLTRQCKLLKISRSSIYYTPVGLDQATIDLMHEIDRIFTKYPFFGSRQIAAYLPQSGFSAGRHRVRRLMGIMGLQAIFKGPNTSKKHPQHRIYAAVAEIAAKRQLHPTQVSTWKRQAIEGLVGVFSDKVKKAENKDGEIKDLHAKIGQLAVENDFLSQGLKR